MKSKLTLTVILIGTSLVLLCLFFLIFQTQTEKSKTHNYASNDTTEIVSLNSSDIDPTWLHFENNEHGYRLYHPPEWRIMDSSYIYEGKESVSIRFYSPTTSLTEIAIEPLVFSILVCKYSGTFKFGCNDSLSSSFYQPNKPGESRHEPNFVTVPEEVIKSSKEYKTALEIFGTLTNI